MLVLDDAGYPACVHFFRAVNDEVRWGGDTIAVTAQPKDVTAELLKGLSIPYTPVESSSLPDRMRFLKMGPEYMLRLVDEAVEN